MAEYCKQCSEDIFGDDFRDFARIAEPDQTVDVLCEGCGEVIPVDFDGKRADGKWLRPHSEEWKARLRGLQGPKMNEVYVPQPEPSPWDKFKAFLARWIGR